MKTLQRKKFVEKGKSLFTQEEMTKIEQKFKEKKVNEKTQEDVFIYAYANNKAFPSQDTNKLVFNILEYIESNAEARLLLLVRKSKGRHYSKAGKTDFSKFSYDSEKKFNRRLGLMDRLATTTKVKGNLLSRDDYKKNMIKRIEAIFSGKKIKEKSFNKRLIEKIIDALYKSYLSIHNNENCEFISGISSEYDIYRNKIGLAELNKSITEYKKRKYCKELGMRYDGTKSIIVFAELVSSVIGEEQMIKLHAEHNYDEMAKKFKDKCGIGLDKIIVLDKHYISPKDGVIAAHWVDYIRENIKENPDSNEIKVLNENIEMLSEYHDDVSYLELIFGAIQQYRAKEKVLKAEKKLLDAKHEEKNLSLCRKFGISPRKLKRFSKKLKKQVKKIMEEEKISYDEAANKYISYLKKNEGKGKE